MKLTATSVSGRALLIGGALAAMAASIGVIALAWNWPFTEQAVRKALEDRFAREVQIRSFRRTYFPPGCVAEGVSFLHRKRKDLPPLISAQSLIVRGSYTGLIGLHKRVDSVQVAGLHVLVPPRSPDGQHSVMPLTTSTSGQQLAIGEMNTDGAVLEFIRPGKEPFKLEIHRVTLNHVGENGPVTYRAWLLNPEPPGEIRSEGQLGPWDSEEPGRTPVAGSYTYDHADLGVFHGIAGRLSSRGKFSGTLDHLDAEGQTDVPDFHVSTSSHTIHLISNFLAVVDATNGDTSLNKILSRFRRTIVVSSGVVGGHPGQHGKTAALDLAVNSGRIEDLLVLFTEDTRPSMTGKVNLRAKVEVPPGPVGFLRKLRLDGDFGVGEGQFTNVDVQAPVNRLTKSARGESKDEQADDPETVLSNLKGHVSVRDGIATLSKVSFTAADTFAEIAGTYNLLDKTVRLRGVLHTNGKLSDTTSGFKAVVLKGLRPFLKKKSVTVVPFTITGTSSDPSFALDLKGKRHIS